MNENGDKLQPELESARNVLRNRWEFASVLNFLNVFEPVIETNLKLSAEEIEMALIQPNKCLAQLHISLLKGIPPVHAKLKEPDAWVMVLSKKLSMWWPWVAEGDFPLTAAKGEEMTTYNELDPTIRLVVLKALCEIRADQHDVVSYINDEIKVKKDASTFQKSNIGEDGKGTSYWLDGNETLGFRLFKEVTTFRKKGTSSTIGCQWETVATNLEEFQKVVDEYSSSKSKLEIAVSETVLKDAIPVLTKLHKKRQRELHKKNGEQIINNFCRSGIARSCRIRKPTNYTFDEYDKAISEAIRETKRTKTRDEQMSQKNEIVAREDPKHEIQPADGETTKTEDVSEDAGEETDENDNGKYGIMKTGYEQPIEKKETDGSTKSKSENIEFEIVDDSDEETDDKNITDEVAADSVEETDEDNKENTNNIRKVNHSFVAKRIASKKLTVIGDRSVRQIQNFGTKKQLRQRPNRNTAIESVVVPDSEDEISCEDGDN
ncbi:DDT domain-containing protein DDR4 [Rutidosis leptorrhynchoides]|uniref:DDT domain-containing protein DDR4 n=1 Tax=Rutidosis leptorrhynchoides TaxID=125765 RepID=UPI003A991576